MSLLTKFPKEKYHYQNGTYESGFIFDFWSCSSAQKDSNGNKFAGAYPAGFLKRWKTAFSNTFTGNNSDILHVCSGRIPAEEGLRLDMDNTYNPDYLGNAENILEEFPALENTFTWAISDSPYNAAASLKYYGVPLLNKSKMLKSMAAVTKKGGFVGVLDQTTPAGKPASLKKIALIAVTSIPNLDARIFTVYQKLA